MVIKDKKGDTTAWGVIISIVLALVVVWLVYSFITGSFNPLISATKNLPQEKEAAILACNNVIKVGGADIDTLYCGQKRAYGSDNLVTCDYLEVQKLLSNTKDCGANTLEIVAKRICIDEFKTKVNAKLYVNNKKCTDLVACADIGGAEIAGEECATRKKTAVEGLKGASPDIVCCI